MLYSKYSKLPLELIYYILLYTGIVKYRNGKYIYQISKTDERYKIFESIPRYKVCHIANKYIMYVLLKLTSNHSKYISVNIDFENNQIEYIYLHLLHIDKDKQYVKYTCPIY